MVYLMLLAGFVLLILGGDMLVRGSVSLSRLFNIPTIVVGLTVIAFGTSAPELFVSVKAALEGEPGIALGNVVGSNIANILLVLGLPAIITATDCRQPFVKENLMILTLVTILLIIMCWLGSLSFVQGVILLTLLIAFLLLQAHRARSSDHKEDVLGDEAVELIEGKTWMPSKNWQIALAILAGLIALPLGANLTIDSASEIARNFGVSNAVIALTVIALGTSLPELAAVIPAALRGEAGLTLGNIIGSNLFNILAVLGTASFITTIPVEAKFLQFDLWIMLGATLLLLPVILYFKRMGRLVGLAFFTGYLLYIFYSFSPVFVAQKIQGSSPHTPATQIAELAH